MNDISQLEQRLLREPFNAALRLEYAEALMAQEDWKPASEQLALLLDQNEDKALVCTAQARCFLKIGEPEEAVKLYRRATSCDGFSPDEELEELMETARPQSVPELSVVQGGKEVADKVEPLFSIEEGRVNFNQIAGMEELKKTLRLHIIEPFLRPSLFARFKKKAGGGILLYGPPGCGKTLIARAIATECKATYMSVGISDVLNMWMGESERNLAIFFEKARAEKPTVLFFDELDALAFSRSKARSENSRTIVNEFLSQLDGIDSQNDQLLVLAATNMPWDVDAAMKRPGRFSRQIFVPPPDEEARKEMFRLKADGVPCDTLDFTQLAQLTPHCSGADIDGIIDQAKETLLADIITSGNERNLTQGDLTDACVDYTPTTLDWLTTARNLVKYAGADASYKEVERYLKSIKFK